ncbi:PAS domain S-box-containing protein [Rhodoferax ferrireducens]|uniref:histidine kinase n=1 Tax=Rhodoferax ferrireducens TaxID=192843 RepID=A0ABU2C6L6_9BURK|nr:response regulator [Rhodoferax ferrireducens]MDR7376977.1 PAS domain S-box-containing protein [Rhodoferax ferrireducens]
MSPREIQLLLVDDDPSAIQVMSRMLAQYPDQRFATSGEIALRLAAEAPPDLILLDVDMPSMTGFEVCADLKANPALAHIPVIFVTSHDESTPLRVAAWQKGAADFVTKPLVASQLTARVSAQLRAARLIEDLKRDSLFLETPLQPLGGQTPRLLIVDDDIASIHILRHTLAAVGNLHFAKTGEEALLLARQLLPDLILLDAHMPGVDGFDVCRSLKSEAAFKHVPIVFVTRFSDLRYEMRALDLGAADFIAKPYTPAVLQARVRNLLDLKQRTDAELQAVRDHWRQVGDARVADIVGAASDAIVTYNAAGKLVLINAAACRMFGVGHEQVIGSAVQALLGDALPMEDMGRSEPTCTTIARADGVRLPVELSVSSVGKGANRLTTVMLRDNSDRERLEAESRSRIEAETASRTKSLMMSYIAHEMGNPLNGLLGFAHIIGADTEYPLAPAQAKRLEHVLACGRRLQGLMRDVMDIGRFEAGKLLIHLRPVDAARCAADALAAVSAQAEQAGVALSLLPVPPSSWVCADTGRLHQCLVNLLTNAIKYNHSGGWARITLKADAQQLVIAVSDNGMGMDALQCQHLFEPFNRLGREDDVALGAGLGLVITRQLVEAMQGSLRVESQPGEGSCFTIALPGALPAAAGA